MIDLRAHIHIRFRRAFGYYTDAVTTRGYKVYYNGYTGLRIFLSRIGKYKHRGRYNILWLVYLHAGGIYN